MRRVLAILGAAALAAALSYPATARGNTPLSLPSGYPPGGEKQDPVEQQSDWPWLPGPTDCSADANCVINPLPCAWDIDDHWQSLQVDQVIAGFSTTTGTVCQVSDASAQYRTIYGTTAWWTTSHGNFAMHLTAPSPALVISVTFAPQGRTFSLSPVHVGKGYVYEFCGNATYDPGDPALGIISGSGGGIGLRTDITVSVTNPARQAVRGVSVDIQQIGTGGGTICVESPPKQYDYPFIWTQT